MKIGQHYGEVIGKSVSYYGSLVICKENFGGRN